jgi:two-component system sensor histidine kinase PilS (NtrC family)
VIQPHFAPLGSARDAPVLVFLEDTSQIAARVQQSKLASLGRLSASIAHEIRNPVGAMSHAAQLLAEAPGLPQESHRLTEIITRNGHRVSDIVESVMSMSRRGESRPEQLELGAWLAGFREEFCATMQVAEARLRLVPGDPPEVEVRVDPGHLRQIVWNLCENAIRHGLAGSADGVVELRASRLRPSMRPCLEVGDPGPGIAPEVADRMFEPFFTRGSEGSGLGLFLARELAQANSATLLYEPRTGGGSLFRIVFTDPQRWQT